MKNWDLFIRTNHWLVTLLFFNNYFELNRFVLPDVDDLHLWAGYLLVLCVLARLVWAFIGPSNARLRQFFPSLHNLLRHVMLLKQGRWQQADKNHKSHNPLGALMVVFLWVLLLSCAITGYMQELDAFWGEAWLQDLHECLANITLAAVAIHITAVIVTQILCRNKLIQAMLWR